MVSYWEKKYLFPHFDILIVGSGIVGLSSAIHLARKFPSYRIAVVERAAVPCGASTKNAGFACFGTIGELLDDQELQSEQEIIETISMRWAGLRRLLEMVPPDRMNYINNGGYELCEDKEQFDLYESRLEGINALISEATGLSSAIKIKTCPHAMAFHSSAFFNTHEAQLNPALMIRSLQHTAQKAGIRFIHGFEVKDYVSSEKVELESTEGLKLSSDRLVLCTNAFTNRLREGLDIIPARNQVVITRPIEGLDIRGCFHYERGYIYFRNIDNRILLGGARHLALEQETTDQFGSNEEILQYLNKLLTRILPGRTIEAEYSWSGIIATGKSKKPIICQLDDNVFAAVRLGGMGVAIGAAVGESLSELVSKGSY